MVAGRWLPTDGALDATAGDAVRGTLVADDASPVGLRLTGARIEPAPPVDLLEPGVLQRTNTENGRSVPGDVAPLPAFAAALEDGKRLTSPLRGCAPAVAVVVPGRGRRGGYRDRGSQFGTAGLPCLPPVDGSFDPGWLLEQVCGRDDLHGAEIVTLIDRSL